MNPLKFSFFLLLGELAIFYGCRSQSKTDSILSKKADSLNVTDINTLIKSGYMRNTDAPIVGTFMVAISQNNDIKNWTIKQLLDSVKARMKQVDDAVRLKNNYGRDSVFIRSPGGGKMFIGMGELTFEKIIAEADLNLPEDYNGDYDLKINSPMAIKKLSLLVADSEYPVVTGNVMLYKRDSGQLGNTKIGDIFEISKRIVASKEFAPFLNSLK